MKKRNSISLFLIALIAMLSVYYLNTPTVPNDLNENGDDTVAVQGDSFELFENYRLELDFSRNELISQLKLVLASEEISLSEKNDALDAMQKITETMESELNFEVSIKSDTDYDAVFVHLNAEEMKVTINILSDEHSVSEANSLILKAKQEFGVAFDVIISYVSEDSDAVST